MKEAETLAKESLKIFEIQSNIHKNIKSTDSESNNEGKNIDEDLQHSNAQKIYMENKITRKISSVLEFLAEIYDLKQE